MDSAATLPGPVELDARAVVRAPGHGKLWVGIAIVGLAALAGVAADVFNLGEPNQTSLTDALEAPSVAHPFGTDDVGRDVFLRTLYATPLDLRVGLVATLVPLALGLVLGVAAATLGRRVDAVIVGVVDFLLAFPFIVLVMGTVAILGAGLTGVYIGLMIKSLPTFIRLARAEMLVLREQQFMLAAQTLGFSRSRILFRHGLPHVIRPAVVYAPVDMLANILYLATLSYLGLGVQPPTPEWGGIIADGQDFLLNAWWISTLPGIFVVVVGLGLFLIGDGLAEKLNVKTGGKL